MPWLPSDAPKHIKAADTPKKRKRWAAVANAVLKTTGDHVRAIRIANSMIECYEPLTLVVLEDIHGLSLYDRLCLEVEAVPGQIPPQHLPQQQSFQQNKPRRPEEDVAPVGKLDVSRFPDSVRRVTNSINSTGARALLVGGSVRDSLHNAIHGNAKSPKDFDVEVYGMDPDRLERHLGTIGKVSKVGKAFGVIKLVHGDDDFDVSVPRRENKIGKGHKGFMPEADPKMTISEAGRRRDFTMNSVAMDPLTGDVYDPHNGIEDIKNGILRATDINAFSEDPLRILRGAQFAARLGMKVHPKTMAAMQASAHELRELSPERVHEEWSKLVRKGEKPSLGLKVMRESGALEQLHPELSRLQGTQHRSGIDLWEHANRAADNAADATAGMSDEDKIPVRYAALLHNVGRPETTVVGPDGRPQSIGHAEAGAKIVGDIFGKQFGSKKKERLTEKVQKLVAEHETPHELIRAESGGPDAEIRRLAKRLAPASIEQLVHLTQASHAAHEGQEDEESPAARSLLDRAKKLGVLKAPLKNHLNGTHLIGMGVKKGPAFRKILDHVYEKQMDGEVTNEEEAKMAAMKEAERLGVLQAPPQEESLFFRAFYPEISLLQAYT